MPSHAALCGEPVLSGPGAAVTLSGGTSMSRGRRASWISLCLSLAAAALIAGCGRGSDDLPCQAVSGEVKLDGSPMKSGMIQFMPTETGESTTGAAGIVDGRYAISSSEGLVPGNYQVSVTSDPAPSAAQPTSQVPGDPLPPPKETIPSMYNSKTTLGARV